MTSVSAIAAIGECMVEMNQSAPATYEQTFGGDTANTAIYLARLLAPARVDYISAVGDDPYSGEMLAFLAREGVGIDAVRRIEGRMPGLYFIRTDGSGERSFYYYRSAAAARDMFKGQQGKALLDMLADYDWLYLTGITLSILDADQRLSLLEALRVARSQGGRVVFDGNYRPRGWPSPAAAREACEQVLRMCDFALMTFDDERVLYGDEQPQSTVERLLGFGGAEAVVKLGDGGCLVAAGGKTTAVGTEAVAVPHDTTAAGDSFNAAYLAARMEGLDPEAAAVWGNRLAGEVIRHPGAVMAREFMPLLA